MRKILIGFVGLIVLTVATVLIAPGFIDWNTYKAEITAQVKAITGRELVIGGDVKIAILPAPAIVANDVTFANASGGTDPQMVRLGSLAVNVALGPLMGGDVQVTKVRLVDPVVLLEVLADGRQNWTFEKLESNDAAELSQSTSIDLSTGQPITTDSGPPLGPGLQLDNFEIVNGTVIYRDAVAHMEEQIDSLNATLKAVSLSGPFESIGSLNVRGIPLSYEIGADGIFQGRTVPVSVLIRSDATDASVGINGNIVNLSQDAKFTGRLKAQGQSLAAIIDAISPTGELPGGINQAFSAEGDMTATAGAVRISDLAVKLGDASASGFIEADLADNFAAAADFSINHINLDNFLALASYTGVTAQQGNEDATQTESQSSDSGASVESNTATQVSEAVETLRIPENVSASLALGIDAITFQGDKVGPVRLNADLANGEVTLSQFSTQLPGATDVAMFGFMTMQGGAPVFDGEAEVSVGDVRRLARWAQLDLSALPNGRLRRVNAKANVKASTENIQISGIDVAFDGSRLTGGVTVALRKRPAFGASFALDRIDLEGYLPTTKVAADESTAPANDSSSGNSEGAAEQEKPSSDTSNPLAVLTALTTFDANLKASVGEIVHQGTSVREIAFDGTLFSGALTVKQASVADLAGASATVSGVFSELGGNPRFGDVQATFKAKSVENLAALLAIDLPISAKAIGAVSAAATLNGPVLQPALKGSASALGAKGTFDGGLSLLPIKNLVDGSVTLEHGDVAKLMSALGVSYQPSGKIGGLNVSTRLSGGAEQINLDDLSGALGALKFNGSTKVRLDGALPRVSTIINTNEFTIDPFLPAKQSAAVMQGFDVTPRPVLSSGAPWPDDPLDLSALNGLDGDFRIHSDAVNYGSYRLEDADVIATLDNGVLKADRVSAILFGGQVNIKGLLNAQGTPSTDATLSFENASVSNMLSSILGKPTATGAFTFQTALNASGASVADMVAALDGNGSFVLKGLDVKGSAKGTPLAGILGLVQSFGQLGAGLSGQSGDGLADATGSFVLNDGVAQIGDFRLSSGLGNGAAAGSIDLAGWTMDVSGTMKMAQNILGQLLTQKAGVPTELPFRVSGALDSPSVKLDTASLGNNLGGGATLPGLDKLDEKVPGLGSVLQGVLGGALGGGSTTQQQSPPPQTNTQTDTSSGGTPEPQPQTQQQSAPEPQQIKPEDLLKQIFKF